MTKLYQQQSRVCIESARETATRIATLVGLLVVMWIFAPMVQAEPYIAVREGYKCSQCHVNKTGGGKRNDFANTYVQTRLANSIEQWLPLNEPGEKAVTNIYHGRLNDFFSMGADIRFVYSRTETPNIDQADTLMGNEDALMYFEFDMVPDKAAIYADFDALGAVKSREFFMLFSDLPLSSYVKVGKFFLASGFRLQDDSAWVRAKPGFTYGFSEQGVEVGIEPGPLSIQIWQTDTDNKRGILAQYVATNWRLGMSYNSDSIKQKDVNNLFGGYHIGRFTFLFEKDNIKEGTVEQEAALIETNFMLTKGHNLKYSYEWFDENLNAEGDNVTRTSLVYEPFVNQFLQPRVGYRAYDGQTNNDAENRTEMFLELHGIFY